LKRVEHERFRQRAEVEADGVIHEIDLPLAGDFQIYNALVAAGLAIATGTPIGRALAALERLKGAPGRLDLVGTAANGAPVYVDYAHKPDALENVLASVRPFTTGRVIVVFGCGGDRDRGKRPIMGEIATRLADVVIITDDNPRSEVPETIRAAILAAAPGAIEIADRRAAIHEAVAMLHPGDTLIIAGKGHEEGQTIGSETFPFSDHEEVRKALEERAV
jgi:UDP-N-acetylmuramoyl-L-alanyl-D-glutamate--2,6-diaminopimelate ligase